ncbi:MAG: FxsA family protein [Gammaproteobacteria bacterium]|nr:FxsA family protein [Gammaproteobacteria bacterium]
MFPVFALIFLIVPVVEIYILIQVGEVIGALWTIFFVVLTAVIGVQLLKSQGLSTLTRAQQKMNSGEMPAKELMEGFALVIAGAFLLTPGFFTDTVGFFLLFPLTRSMIVGYLVARVMASGRFNMNTNFQSDYQSQHKKSSGDVIEGVKYHKDDE